MNKVPAIRNLGTATQLVTQGSGPAELASVAWQLVEDATTWVKVISEETTRRAEIQAWEATSRARIEAQRDVLLQGLQLTHDERRENFKRLFERLDAAIRADDTASAADLLQSITDLAKSSPFKELATVNFVVNELRQSDRTWKL